MLISFLLTTLPAGLMIVGGIVASIGALHIAVSVPGTKRPSDKGGVAVALGLALVLVMAAWNAVLDAGFKLLGIDPETAITVQEKGDVFGELALAGQIVMITVGAVAIATLVLAATVGAVQRATLARATVQAPIEASPMPRRPAAAADQGHEPPTL